MSCQTCHVFTSTKEKEFIIATAYEINQKLPVKSCKQLANCVSLYNLWRLFGAIYVPIQNRVLPSQFVIFHSYISVLRQGVVKTFVSSRISAMHACWKLEVLLKTYLYFVQNRLRWVQIMVFFDCAKSPVLIPLFLFMSCKLWIRRT